MLIHEMSLHGVQVGVWCDRSATIITGPILFWDHKFTPIRCRHSDTNFKRPSDYEKSYDFFFNNAVQKHTPQTILSVWYCWWNNNNNKQKMWPPRSPDLNPCDLYLWYVRRLTAAHWTTGLFISPSGISELDCATTKTDTAERSIAIGRESLQVFFLY